MKKLILLALVAFSMTATAQQPLRCKFITRYGQCTNEAINKDTLCATHTPATKAVATPLSSKPATSKSKTTTNINIKTSSASGKSSVKSSSSSARTSSKSKSSKSSYGGQCAATTKKGTRCSRSASSGSAYCWQHSR